MTPPGPDDRAVPDDLVRALEPLATRWTAGASDVPSKLRALEHRLQTDYRYSLEFDRPDDRDPIADFLLRDRQGHCEYFASAMALLARSIGVPARVVGGYRVTERNDWGDYYLVRQRNAHSWVEAWVPEQGWRRYDPTPPAELALAMPTTSPWDSALADLVRTNWAASLRWLDQRTPLEIVGALLALVALGAGARLLRSLRQRRTLRAAALYEPALPCFERLTGALTNQGIVRAPHESIEKLARRLRAPPTGSARADRAQTSLSPELRDRTAGWLMRYAALRYGGVGDEGTLTSEVEALVARLGA